MQHPKEQILVVPAKLAVTLAPLLFNPVPFGLEQMLLAEHSFRDREEAETNYDFKQVIPYIVVRHGEHYLMSRRTAEQQEKRLHNKYSLGQGGHVKDTDFESQDPILTGLLRELREEFVLAPEYGCAPVGLINDDSTDVGRVHMGIAYELRVMDLRLEVAEKGLHEAQWLTAPQLREYYPNMESWSKILMDHVILPA